MGSDRTRKRTGIAPVIAVFFALQVMFGILAGSAAFSPDAAAAATAPTTTDNELGSAADLAVEEPLASSGNEAPEASSPQQLAAPEAKAPQILPTFSSREIVRMTDLAAEPEELVLEALIANSELVEDDSSSEPVEAAIDETTIQSGPVEETVYSFLGVELFIDPIEFSPVRQIIQPEPEVLSLTLGALPVQVFPVVGGGSFSSSFGAPRPEGRTHKGNDIFADKMAPVIAVAPGTVVWASEEPGENCCFLKLRHDDGSETLYIHLNNDTPGTDDGLGWGLAEGIAKGTRVDAGQLVGYVGDSGNAEETPAHLHFEYHAPNSEAVDPNSVLKAAPVVTEVGAPVPLYVAATEQLPFTGPPSGWLWFAGLVLLVAGLAALGLSRRAGVG